MLVMAGSSSSASFILAPVVAVSSSASLSLKASAFSTISFVMPARAVPLSTISWILALPSDSSGAAPAQDLPSAAAPNAARVCGSSIFENTSESCLKASKGSFASTPSFLKDSPSLPMLTESLLIDAATLSRSEPDWFAASFRPARSPTVMPVVLLRSLSLSIISIEP